MEYYINEEILYRPTGTKYIYVVTGRDNDYVGEGEYSYPEAVIELAGLYGVSEKYVKKVVGDYIIFNAIYLVSFSTQDMYNKVDEFLKENDLKNYKEGIKLLQDEGYEENIKDTGAYAYVEENIKDIKKVYYDNDDLTEAVMGDFDEKGDLDYGDDVSNMDNQELALYLGISEQEVKDDRDSAEEQARSLMNDPEQDF